MCIRDRYFSEWLNTDIYLNKNDLDNDKIEFSAEVKTKVAYYYLSGIMEEEEFNRIIEKMYFK